MNGDALLFIGFTVASSCLQFFCTSWTSFRKKKQIPNRCKQVYFEPISRGIFRTFGPMVEFFYVMLWEHQNLVFRSFPEVARDSSNKHLGQVHRTSSQARRTSGLHSMGFPDDDLLPYSYVIPSSWQIRANIQCSSQSTFSLSLNDCSASLAIFTMKSHMD